MTQPWWSLSHASMLKSRSDAGLSVSKAGLWIEISKGKAKRTIRAPTKCYCAEHSAPALWIRETHNLSNQEESPDASLFHWRLCSLFWQALSWNGADWESGVNCSQSLLHTIQKTVRLVKTLPMNWTIWILLGLWSTAMWLSSAFYSKLATISLCRLSASSASPAFSAPIRIQNNKSIQSRSLVDELSMIVQENSCKTLRAVSLYDLTRWAITVVNSIPRQADSQLNYPFSLSFCKMMVISKSRSRQITLKTCLES